METHLGNQHYARKNASGMIEVFTERGRIFFEKDTFQELLKFAEKAWNVKITVEALPPEEGKR